MIPFSGYILIFSNSRIVKKPKGFSAANSSTNYDQGILVGFEDTDSSIVLATSFCLCK